MNRLPSDQREALVMVVLHGMSYEELAEATGCAVGTAKSRVFRARRQLHAWLVGDEDARPALKNAALDELDVALKGADGRPVMAGKAGRRADADARVL